MLDEAHRHLFCTGVVLQRNWFSFRNKVVWVWSSYKQSVLIVVFLFRPVVLCRYNNNITKQHTFCFHWNIKELFLTMYFSFLHLYHFQKHCCLSTLAQFWINTSTSIHTSTVWMAGLRWGKGLNFVRDYWELMLFTCEQWYIFNIQHLIYTFKK